MSYLTQVWTAEDRRNALPKTHCSEHSRDKQVFHLCHCTLYTVCFHPYLPACDLCCVLAALVAGGICALLGVLQAQDGADC